MWIIISLYEILKINEKMKRRDEGAGGGDEREGDKEEDEEEGGGRIGVGGRVGVRRVNKVYYVDSFEVSTTCLVGAPGPGRSECADVQRFRETRRSEEGSLTEDCPTL